MLIFLEIILKYFNSAPHKLFLKQKIFLLPQPTFEEIPFHFPFFAMTDDDLCVCINPFFLVRLPYSQQKSENFQLFSQPHFRSPSSPHGTDFSNYDCREIARLDMCVFVPIFLSRIASSLRQPWQRHVWVPKLDQLLCCEWVGFVVPVFPPSFTQQSN